MLDSNETLLLIFFGLVIPFVVFIYGIKIYFENKKKGKIILITATIYSIISFGVCGGFGF